MRRILFAVYMVQKERNMKSILFTMLVCVILILIAVTDARQRRIPNILLGAFFIVVLFSAVVCPEVTWNSRVLGSVSVSVILLAATWIRPGAFGAGDVKLMAVSGLLLGMAKNLTAFLFAVVLAAVYCLPGLVLGGRKRTAEIAFGPFLCIGIVMSIFWGEKFIQWYIS